jgi:hypothetical protein
MFGDDAFKSPLSAGVEQGITIAIKLIAKLGTALVVGSNEMLEAGSSLHERLLTEVLAIEVEQIKRIEDDAVVSPPYGRA